MYFLYVKLAGFHSSVFKSYFTFIITKVRKLVRYVDNYTSDS
jgi:hypothetical protein